MIREMTLAEWRTQIRAEGDIESRRRQIWFCLYMGLASGKGEFWSHRIDLALKGLS